MLYQLAYLSTSSAWGRPRLIELLRVARQENRAHGITGILLYRAGGFVQLLEGDPVGVKQLYANIVADQRHSGATQIWDCVDGPRWFAEWSMAFRDLEDDPVTEPGLSDILRGPPDASRFGHEAVLELWKLLRPQE